MCLFLKYIKLITKDKIKTVVDHEMMLIKVMRIIGPCFHTIHEAVEN